MTIGFKGQNRMNGMGDPNRILTETLIGMVNDIINTYSGTLIRMAVAGDKREIKNNRHSDNFLSEVDVQLHSEYQTRVSAVLPAFIYASEEEDPRVYPSDHAGLPPFLVIVDPLDTSELAVRGLCGYTHIMVYSLAERSPIISIVGDMFHEIRFFYAFRNRNGKDEAHLMTRDGEVFSITSSQETDLNKALVTNYSIKPRKRFLKIAEQRAFLDSLSQPDENGEERGRIGVDFGSIGLCHVAAGFTDAMIEVAKGFTLWDVLPGQYILCAAGGVVASLEGKEIPLELSIETIADVKRAMERRQKFVAAGNSMLLESILATLDN